MLQLGEGSGFFFDPQSAIHDLQSYMIRDHSRFEHFLEESALRGRAALPERTFAEKGPCL